jgi:hypothetical protein
MVDKIFERMSKTPISHLPGQIPNGNQEPTHGHVTESDMEQVSHAGANAEGSIPGQTQNRNVAVTERAATAAGPTAADIQACIAAMDSYW